MQAELPLVRTRHGWDRIGFCTGAEMRTGRTDMYHGIVRRWCLRVGPVAFYRIFLRTTWPLPEAPRDGRPSDA